VNGDLVRIAFGENVALMPDDAVVGLCRELILQRIYMPAGHSVPRGLVIDAGAHVGVYSLMVAGSAERVIALEPDPVNYRVLELNLALNETRTRTAVNAALWTHGGEVQFHRAPYTEGGAVGNDGGVTVAAVTLDDLVAGNPSVDVLKLDVEGAEFDVLAAARCLDQIETIMAELHFHDPAMKERLVDVLTERGFNVRIIDEDALRAPRQALQVLKNWSALRGHVGIKAAALAYLAISGGRGALHADRRATPLMVAVRASAT
jgi:FkbM family methyltransferase